MLTTVRKLRDDLARRAIQYCHWKSNDTLDAAVNGIGDLDLLVARNDAAAFLESAAACGFRLAIERSPDDTPFVYHLFAVDDVVDHIIHLHVYFRLITAGAILKNHLLPLEQMLLAEASVGEALIPVPSPEADLIALVARKTVEMRSPVEHLVLSKDRTALMREVEWLLSRIDVGRLRATREKWMPSWSQTAFDRALVALRRGPGIEAWIMATRGREIGGVRLRSSVTAEIVRAWRLVRIVVSSRLRRRPPGRYLLPGGMIVAFVGAEASGKSTLSKAVAGWYAEHFEVHHVHLGKPPRIVFSRLVMMCVQVMLRLRNALFQTLRRQRRRLSEREEAERPVHPLIAVLDVIDRTAAVRRCVRLAMRGYLVVTDRYPTDYQGGLDGPSIAAATGLRGLLSKWELKRYSALPRPDLVVMPRAPLALTLQRNAARGNAEAEAFVRVRHSRAQRLTYSQTPVCVIDATRPLEDCISEARRLVFGRNVGMGTSAHGVPPLGEDDSGCRAR